MVQCPLKRDYFGFFVVVVVVFLCVCVCFVVPIPLRNNQRRCSSPPSLLVPSLASPFSFAKVCSLVCVQMRREKRERERDQGRGERAQCLTRDNHTEATHQSRTVRNGITYPVQIGLKPGIFAIVTAYGRLMRFVLKLRGLTPGILPTLASLFAVLHKLKLDRLQCPKQTQLPTHTHDHTLTHTMTHTYTHTYMYTHTHTLSLSLSLSLLLLLYHLAFFV